MVDITVAVRADLAPTVKLRAGINYGNFILAVKDKTTGKSSGVAIDLLNDLAQRLGVSPEMIAYDMATDTGHMGDDPDFAVGKPEAIVVWGHRAVHEAVVVGKVIAAAYYGKLPRYSYFFGCSTGGQQALMEAQRYPDDFDGIVAGAPGSNRTHLNVGFLWQFLQNHEPRRNDRLIIPPAKLPMIARAAFSACRKQNGAQAGGLATDAYLNDPLTCHFDPETIQCTGDDAATCLTAPQVQALKKMYDGARNPRTGERIYFGWPVGSENAGANPNLPGWSLYWADPKDASRPARQLLAHLGFRQAGLGLVEFRPGPRRGRDGCKARPRVQRHESGSGTFSPA